MGARARARAIKDRGLIELGTESYATVQKEAARNYEHQKEMRRSTIERELLDGISEIGDALYTRKPDRPRRLRGPGPDHVGGAAA